MTSRGFYGTILLLALIGLGLIWYSYPGDKELALIYFKDRRYSQAYPLLKRFYTEGDTDLNVLLPLVDVDVVYGYTREGVEVMEKVVELYPDEERAWRRLGALYLYDNRPYDYYVNLGKIALRFKHEADIREVIGFYEDLADEEKVVEFEKELIADGYAKEADISNLAFLQARQGDTEGALETLDHLPLDQFESIETAILYISLLLEDGQEDKALKIALSFDERNHDVNNALRFADLFENQNLTEMALQILDPFTDELQTNPLLLTTYAAYAEKVGKTEEVYQILDRLFEKDLLPPNTLATYISMLIDRKLTDRLQEVIKKTNLDVLDDASLIDLIEYDDQQFSTLVQTKISEERLKSSPLLSLVFIALNPSRGDFNATLEKFHLPPEQLVDLSRDLIRLNLTDVAKEVFVKINNVEGLSADQLRDYALMGADLQKAASALALVNQVKDQALAIQAKAILTTALGETSSALTLLNLPEPLDLPFLEELTRIALDVKNGPVALKSAQLWFEREPNNESKLALAEALFLNGNEQEALTYYQELIEEDPENLDIIEPYLLALQKEGLPGTFEPIFKQYVEDPNISLEAKQGWAEAFVERDAKGPARAIYRYLILQDRSNKDYVDDYLDLLGDKPTYQQLKWIVKQARVTPTSAKSPYLDYLNNQKEYCIVVSLVDPSEFLNNDVMLNYLEALIGVKEYEEFRCLAWEVLYYFPLEQLQEVLTLAYDSDVFDVSLEYARQLGDTKRRAFSAFELGAYSEAYPLLMCLFDEGDPDLLIPFYIGEILWDWDFKCEAYGYYAVAKNRIEWVFETTYEEEILTKAMSSLGRILYNEQNEVGALEVYEDLLFMFPNNYHNVADYADHLTTSQYWGTAGWLFDNFLSTPSCQIDCFCTDDAFGLFRAYIEKVKYLRLIGRTKAAFCLLKELCPLQDTIADPSIFWKSMAETEHQTKFFRQSNLSWWNAREENPVNELYPVEQWDDYQDWRSFGDFSGELRHTTPHQTEHLYTANVFERFTNAYFIDAKLEMDNWAADAVLNAQTGTEANERGVNYRATVLGGYDMMGGDRYVLGFYGASQLFGATIRAHWRDVKGDTFIELDYHYPSWEIIETVSERGFYNQALVGRNQYFTPHFYFEGYTAYRFWGIHHIPEVANSWYVFWNWVYTFDDPSWERFLGDGGYFNITYELDAEYIFNRKLGVDPTGTVFQRIPLITQETHTLFLFANKVFNDSLRAEAFVGWSYNRLGRSGPDYGLEVIFGRKQCWEVRLDASHEPSTTVNGGVVDRFLIGAHVFF